MLSMFGMGLLLVATRCGSSDVTPVDVEVHPRAVTLQPLARILQPILGYVLRGF